jgi:hypothetical protein
VSIKTGKVTSASASVSSGRSATAGGAGPPPWTQTFADPNDSLYALLLAAYTKGSDVEITYDDSTQPPTPLTVKAL